MMGDNERRESIESLGMEKKKQVNWVETSDGKVL
jgi:hypothetical protein